MREEDNPFLQNRARARARHVAEARYQTALSKRRVRLQEFQQDRHQLVDHPTKQRDAFAKMLADVEYELHRLQLAKIEYQKKLEIYTNATESGAEVFNSKWTPEALAELSEVIPPPPSIDDVGELPSVHRVIR